MHDDVKLYFETETVKAKTVTREKGHGRIETREYLWEEDNCRMRKDNSGENFAVIRHIALNLLKKDDAEMSIKSRRHRCAYDDDYLYKILFASNIKL